MKILIYRHLKIFFKSPSNIILSFLSSLVIISLYFLFIRDFTIKAVNEYGFISNYTNLFVDRLMTSGLLIVIGATSVLSIIFIFVRDNYTGTIKDFLVSPISYLKIIYSYFMAALIVSTIITIIAYISIEIFFIYYYNDYSSIIININSLITILLSNIIASLLILIIALGITNFNSFATFQTLYGVIIGFFTGVYIPIGYYPLTIRNIFFYFPLCQTTSILRNIKTNNITTKILSNYPYNIHYILYDTFGIHLTINNKEVILGRQIIMVIIMLIILNLVLILLAKIKKDQLTILS